jgi:adenylate cyclase class 2
LSARDMPHTNIEIKAKCPDPENIRRILRSNNADFKGTDHQIDTYFSVSRGRLKLRQGNIENALIFYNRPNQAEPKQTEVFLSRSEPSSELKEVLCSALDILVTVKKKREIYFIDNVKFHIDALDNLGTFVEIEAIDTAGRIGTDELLKQCGHYMQMFGISREDLIDCSYSDMLIQASDGSAVES